MFIHRPDIFRAVFICSYLLFMNILFICSRNQWRSPTGEAIYKNRQGIQARSAGTEPSARNKVSAATIQWADIVFVMEKKHRQRIQEKYPDACATKQIVVLDIPDEYQYMDEELVEMIRTSVEPYLP